MNRKRFHNLTLLVTTVLISQSLSGCLVKNNCLTSAMGNSSLNLVKVSAKKLPTSQLQTLLDEIVSNQKIPGVAMYISTPQESWRGASGVSSLETKIRMKPDDGFSIASTSKTFVAVLVLQLVEHGQIDLDREIALYLPNSLSNRIPYSEQITVRQLLNHTSGVAEYLSTPRFINATKHRSRSQPWTAKEAIEYIFDQEPQAAPGQKYSYTDTNYILLQLIIERATGRTLAQIMRDRILNPLNLKHTYTELWESAIGTVATGYIKTELKQQSFADINDGNGLGDGSLISTGADLAKFIKILCTEHSLISAKTTKEMFKFIDETPDSAHGLGIERLNTPFGTAFGHTGMAYGTASVMLYFPQQNTSIVVLANQQDVDVTAIALQALSIAIRSPTS